MTGSFQGYLRKTGRPGIRNHLAILSVCGLNGPGARKVAAGLPGVVLIRQPYGRGQIGADHGFQRHMLTRFATHPNTGAALILAPDDAMRDYYYDAVAATGRPVAGLSLQEMGEDGIAMVRAAISEGRRLQAELEGSARRPCDIADLVVAMECGHSDASSGIVANPLVGHLAGWITGHGGAAVFAETMEWLGTEPGLMARCVSAAVADRLDTLVKARHAIAHAAGDDPHLGNPGPQNHAGGISTLEEKSLGAISKGGTGPIIGALAAGETVPGPGLYVMDTPTLSPESISSMVAGGAQLVCFTTGHGNPYGSALAPTIKLTGNPDTARRLPDQIDFDAAAAFTGARTRAALVPELVALTLRVCGGQSVAAERLDEGDEVISRLGPSV
jgi:altronate dehydratase large subunit